MGTIECSQPASKSSWDSQDFGDISTVLKMAHFRKSTRPQWVNVELGCFLCDVILMHWDIEPSRYSSVISYCGRPARGVFGYVIRKRLLLEAILNDINKYIVISPIISHELFHIKINSLTYGGVIRRSPVFGLMMTWWNTRLSVPRIQKY